MSGLHIESHGAGATPLVMIHGWAMHGGILAPLVEALAARYTMYVVDLPGHGYSRDSDIPLEPLACAACDRRGDAARHLAGLVDGRIGGPGRRARRAGGRAGGGPHVLHAVLRTR